MTKHQGGFGLLETLTGLLVFVILVFVGTKAYHNVVANHHEASQIKSLTDAVAATAEKLSGLTLPVLAGAGSAYLEWSEPLPVGKGQIHYRYRTVPRPLVRGVADTTVVGLEVEAGNMTGGAFVATRSFATLIPPNLSARGALGTVSTKAERDAEAAFHSGLVSSIASLTRTVIPENDDKLNSYSCYRPDQCCGFLRDFFKNPGLNPEDGLDEKCLYRCALAGDVAVEQWQKSCGINLCTESPWRDKAACCKAIADGSCKSGSMCARVCIDCHGVDGSTCGPPPCEPYFWNDLFDCERGTFCDGTPLPDGEVAGWGNVKAWCKQPECAAIKATCHEKVSNCCENYWRFANVGKPVDPAFEVCAKISTQQECCNWTPRMGYWNLHCGTDGNLKAAQIISNGQWYCSYPTPYWHDNCKMMLGCGSTSVPPGSPGGGCQSWTGPAYESPWIDPITGFVQGGVSVGGGGGGGGAVITKDGGDGGGGRKGTTRDGDGGESGGGRE